MLILTRRSNERILIGDDIVLVVLGIENNRVKLGIEAPANVTILREEIVDTNTKKSIDAISVSKSANDDINDVKFGTG